MRTGYALVSALARNVFRLGCGVSVLGSENVPSTGAIIIASNHRSNCDPPLIGGMIRREVFFFAKEELFRIPLLGRLITYLNAYPVRRGGFDRTALKRSLEILRQGRALVFFPEGTRAPADGFLRPKIGLGWLVELSRVPVLPVYLHGTDRASFRFRGRPAVRVVIGMPIPAEDLIRGDLRGHELYQSISDAVVERIRVLSFAVSGNVPGVTGIVYDRSIIEDERLR
ncbi:MAG: lysophospholipid acyltransferase family protein [bacterium]|nr:lysophospholipid acyltransferase family protein [bacterium]